MLYDTTFIICQIDVFVFSCTDDIDLYAGGLSERRTNGAIVGPVFQCILGEQFKRIRDGDRFWFERDDPRIGFTKGMSLLYTVHIQY